MVVMIGTTEPSLKLVNNEQHTITPFFGMDREGDFAQMGVGFVNEAGQGSMWGLLAPTMLITSWRAMRILAHLPTVERHTLSHCWYAASGRGNAIETLRAQSVSTQAFDELLTAMPDSQELDRMLTFVHERGIEVNIYELRELVEQGLIDDHPIIAMFEKRHEKSRDRYEARERFIAAPLADSCSLSALFESLGIDNLLDGEPFGGYGMDWGHIKLGDLDSMIKQTSTGTYASSFQLKRTTEPPTTRGCGIRGSDVTMFTTTFGDIETPFYVDATGTKYTFVSAKFRYDTIVVSMEVGDEYPVQLDMTVEALREAIVVKKHNKRWLRRR